VLDRPFAVMPSPELTASAPPDDRGSQFQALARNLRRQKSAPFVRGTALSGIWFQSGVDQPFMAA
jgi:hypothetical protein